LLIGIDTHNLEGKRTGVGRYLFNLLKIWAALPRESNFKFILYFKSEIPQDVPKSALFETKLLNVMSTAQFTHWDLSRAAQKDKLDILFCPAYVAPLFYRGKMALTLHDISYEARPKEFNWLSLADRILLKWVSKKSAKKAAVIFTPSEFSRQEVIKYYKTEPRKIVTTYLAVEEEIKNFNREKAGKEIEAVRVKFGLKDNFIFFVGSIFSRRHLTEVIEAFSSLVKEKKDWQLLLGGRDYTPGQSVLKLAVKKNKEFNREAILQVDFINDNDLKFLYSACVFFVWLSDYEGFGLPVLEAMSVGVPVITSQSSSLVEVAGRAALLLEKNSSVEEIYWAMKRLVEDKQLWSDLAKAGKGQAEKFSWQACAKKTLEALLSVKSK